MALLSEAAETLSEAAETLEAEVLAEVKAGAKRGRSGFARKAINDFLSLPKTKQRAGIAVPLSYFNADGTIRTVKAVAQGINARALASDAPVWAKPEPKRPETYVAMFWCEHTKTGPRDTSNNGDAETSSVDTS